MLVQNFKRKCRRPLSRVSSVARMSTSRLIGWSSEPSLSLVCHPLIFISLTLCGIPPSRSLGARRALYFLSNLARVPLPPFFLLPPVQSPPRSQWPSLGVGRRATHGGGPDWGAKEKRRGRKRERGITCSLGRVICVKWLSC